MDALTRIYKDASLAWVRKLQDGQLSPQSMQKAIGTIPEGKFRSINQTAPVAINKPPPGVAPTTLPNLGQGRSGDYNMASTVAGNFKDSKPGISIWKQPTHTQPEGQGLAETYRPMQQAITRENARLNKQLPQGSQLIAPVHTVNERGAFQTPAVGRGLPGKTPQEQMAALKRIDPEGTVMDAGPHNMNDKGQLFDIMVPNNDPFASGWGMSRLSKTQENYEISPHQVLPHLQPYRLAEELLHTYGQNGGMKSLMQELNARTKGKEERLKAQAVRRHWAQQQTGGADNLFSQEGWKRKIQEAHAAIDGGQPITDPLVRKAVELVRRHEGLSPDANLVAKDSPWSGSGSIFDD